MARSVWKGPFCELKNIKKISKVWSRRSVILPQFVDTPVFIYNGKTFISLKITEDMIGHKFGEFATTRRKPQHKKKK